MDKRRASAEPERLKPMSRPLLLGRVRPNAPLTGSVARVSTLLTLFERELGQQGTLAS